MESSPSRMIRAETPFIVYTHKPSAALAIPTTKRPGSMPVRNRINRADARSRHGVRVANADACYAQAQALLSRSVYAHTEVRDLQGLANSCMVSGFSR